jgi:putative transcriptional regulator
LKVEVSLKNQFLLAMPGLTGTYFGNSVTYICEHNEDGAMGIMVNRPTDVSLVELLSQLGIRTGSTPVEVSIMEGGPVQADRGFILHTDDQHFESSLDLQNGLMLTTAREVLEAIAAACGPRDYLVALGYAGWQGGQLEAELLENAWLTCPADQEVLFHTPYAERVTKAAAALGIDFSLMSGHAGHA